MKRIVRKCSGCFYWVKIGLKRGKMTGFCLKKRNKSKLRYNSPPCKFYVSVLQTLARVKNSKLCKGCHFFDPISDITPNPEPYCCFRRQWNKIGRPKNPVILQFENTKTPIILQA